MSRRDPLPVAKKIQISILVRKSKTTLHNLTHRDASHHAAVMILLTFLKESVSKVMGEMANSRGRQAIVVGSSLLPMP